jgi:CSLREA domain-containing protein
LVRVLYIRFLIIFAVLAGASFLFASHPAAGATTYTVDTPSNNNLTACTEGTDNDCSLRGAINNANVSGTGDLIIFNSEFLTPQTITPTSTALPTLTGGGDSIDATGRIVTVDGSGEPSAFNCLTISSSNNAVIGLRITDCINGISISSGTANTIQNNVIFDNTAGITVGGSNNTIIGNMIGTSVDGTAIHSSGANSTDGVSVTGTGNTIGGDTAAERNIISGNVTGVDMESTATGNFIKGNYVGTNAAGTADLGNTGAGIVVRASSNTIGGTAAGEGNLISGNDANGLEVTGTAITNTIITGNFIGTDGTGDGDLGNSLDGVSLGSGSSGSTVGGITTSARNVISGNNSDGIQLNSASNVIRGNFIGTTASGSATLGNSGHGINFFGGTGSNTIGGTTAGAGNVISGNSQTGLNIFSGGSNTIQGNVIGSDANGTLDLGNALGGITVNTSGNTIGGTDASARNLISGNNSSGVTFSGAGAVTNTVQGNHIGVQGDGASPLPNNGPGVVFSSSASNNTIGVAAGGQNVIAHNVGDGVHVLSGTGNIVRSNVIHSNAGLGIDLGADGVTPNDGGAANDADTGANTLLNFPALTTASSFGATTNVQGLYDGAPNATLTLDFYRDSACDPSGNGEGRTLVGSLVKVTDGSGLATINDNLPVFTPAHEFITATATNVSNNTSEFSNCVEVPPIVVNDVVDPGDGVCNLLSCTLREAITAANSNPEHDLIEFAIGSGAQTITPAAALPAITQPVTIDATSQPGFAGVPLIELAGNLALGSSGLQITGGGSTIKGLVINRWSTHGLNISTGGSNTIVGNYIGVSANGTADLGNSADGILLMNSASNTIGGGAPGEGNVISGNNAFGIRISGAGSTGNVVKGNIIGLGAGGTTDLGNTQDGVVIQSSATGNTIGGEGAGEGNVISGNNSEGVEVLTANNAIKGNLIGTDITGELDLGNSSRGVTINGATGNTIGGATPGARNVISGNGSSGVFLSGTAATGNFVYGNYIGTNITGTLAVGNGQFGGVLISNGQNNDIGGAAPGQGNLISGNPVGIRLDGGAADLNRIRGNSIGLKADGVTALPNSTGIYVASGNSNSIGGSLPGQANIVAFNTVRGVQIEAGNGNTVGANSIYSNGTLGIDLGSPGVTQNDTDDPDTGANRLQNFPLLTAATTGGIDTTIQGTLNSTPGSDFTIDLYYSPACDTSGNGEGQTYLSSVSVTTDAGGDTVFSLLSQVFIATGTPITATATNTTTGDTSEFSRCRAVSFVSDKDGDFITDIFEDACGSDISDPASIPERIGGPFSGLDDDGDTLVDEPLPVTAVSADCDGDGFLGLNENGSPFCRDDLNDDAVDDIRVNDGCPAVGPAESGADCNDSMDNDADGSVNDGCQQIGAISEGALQIGTSDQDPCGLDGWPDNLIDPVDQPANHVDIFDITSFLAPDRHLDTDPGHPFFDPRWDLLPGQGPFMNWINIQDLLALLGGATGAPPMMGNALAFNQTCPWP